MSTAASDASESIVEEIDAGTLTLEQIAGIESDLFGVPNFGDVNINVSDGEIEHISTMMNHVTIQPDYVPKSFLHSTEALLLASKIFQQGWHEAIDILSNNLQQIVMCGCSAHNMMEELRKRPDGEAFDFCLLLNVLQALDLRAKFNPLTTTPNYW